MELQQKGNVPEQLAARLKAFAAADSPDYIVVNVTVESDKPSNMLRQAESTLYKLTTNQLKNDTYLLLKDGKRLVLREYQPPAKDGLGARFIFPRLVDGEPFVSERSGEILFHANLSGGGAPEGTITTNDTAGRFTLNTRYKVKDMMFGGKLEY